MSLKKNRYIVLGLLPLLTACKPIPQTVNNNYYFPNEGTEVARSFPAAHVGQLGWTQQEVKCRIICFSRDVKGALYPIDKSANPIYVKGFVDVPGKRDTQRVCRPQNYGKADISALPEFKDVCKVFVKSCGDGCWAGGNA